MKTEKITVIKTTRTYLVYYVSGSLHPLPMTKPELVESRNQEEAKNKAPEGALYFKFYDHISYTLKNGEEIGNQKINHFKSPTLPDPYPAPGWP